MKPDKIYLSLSLLILITVFSRIISCTHLSDIADIPEICFTGDIMPIISNSCAITGCHDEGGESELSLNSYSEISRNVVPGDPYASRLYLPIIAKGEELMPPGQPLSLENRIKIRVWIEQGAALTTCIDTTGSGGGNNYIARACFTRDIFPVIVSRCAATECHDAITHEEGLNYTTYANVKNSVTPGNPGNSKLYRSITTSGGEDKMPPAGSPQLTVAEIDSIGKWIGYGALNENCGEVCDTINPVTFSGAIWPVIQSTCTGCHSGTSPSGNVLLTSYTNVAAAASGGLLINSLKGTGVIRMPPAGSFSACRIRQFEIWVENGFSNN